jgi:hypothetical protein
MLSCNLFFSLNLVILTSVPRLGINIHKSGNYEFQSHSLDVLLDFSLAKSLVNEFARILLDLV